MRNWHYGKQCWDNLESHNFVPVGESIFEICNICHLIIFGEEIGSNIIYYCSAIHNKTNDGWKYSCGEILAKDIL
jgi:hypothetical protein